MYRAHRLEGICTEKSQTKGSLGTLCIDTYVDPGVGIPSVEVKALDRNTGYMLGGCSVPRSHILPMTVTGKTRIVFSGIQTMTKILAH